MSGINYFIRGLKMIAQPGIRPFVIMPILINVVLFVLFTWLLFSQLGSMAASLEEWLVDWLDWLVWILWLLVGLLWFVIYGYSFSMISNALAAPFYGLLAEKVQNQLSNDAPQMPMTLSAFLALTKRTLIRELQKLTYALPRLLGLILLTLPLYFVPVINALVPVIWFVWGAWSLSLQNLDYAADNNLVGFTEMRRQLGPKRSLWLSFGGISVAASSIPLFNLIAIPAAVAGGTTLWVEQLTSHSSTLPR